MSFDGHDLGARMRANAGGWRRVLGRGDIVHQRPPSDPDRGPIWSALEYGCHVRDVYLLFEERIGRMLSEDAPTFSSWDQDHAAVEGDYQAQDPSRVGYALAVAAGRTADMLDRVSGDQWARQGRRGDGDAFTVESLARYGLHDVVHHLWDAKQGYRAITAGDENGEEEDEDESGSDGSDGSNGEEW